MVKTRMAAIATAAVMAATPAAATADGSEKTPSASVASQIKKLKKQMKALKKQVGAPGAVGPTGPAGPTGATGATGAQGEPAPQGSLSGPAGGDLTGSFPNPQIGALAVGTPELAANAITADSGIANTAQGNYSTKIGTGAIGRSELADGEVRSAEFGDTTVKTVVEEVVAGQFMLIEVACDPGQQLLSGGGEYNKDDNLFAGHMVLESAPTTDGAWTVRVFNNTNFTRDFEARAVCLK